MAEADDIGLAASVPRLANAMPEFRAELEGATKSVDLKAYAAIRAGTMTPELAHSLWLERFSYSNLLKRMETRIKVGQSAGERVADTLNKET